jgi:hypothetical protein
MAEEKLRKLKKNIKKNMVQTFMYLLQRTQKLLEIQRKERYLERRR